MAASVANLMAHHFVLMWSYTFNEAELSIFPVLTEIPCGSFSILVLSYGITKLALSPALSHKIFGIISKL